MDTNFASPDRTDAEALKHEIEIVNASPVLDGLLHSAGGLLAVLDENRQIVALNDSLLKHLGIDSPEEALGLRPGEALKCLHAFDGPAGCGTGEFCQSCGAVIAIVTSLGMDCPVEKVCSLTAKVNGTQVDMALLVRSNPIRIGPCRFLLLFIQDITAQQRRASLERVFFHDISNLITGLLANCDLLKIEHPDSELADTVRHLAHRMAAEVAMQKCIANRNNGDYHTQMLDCDIGQILSEARAFIANHPVRHGKRLEVEFPREPGQTVRTDPAIVLRIISNMITNAFEATAGLGAIRLWSESDGESVSFKVWNSQYIPSDIARRIFQRNFSTRKDAGRGFGTYSMKLFGERVLGGTVTFETHERDGTTFILTIPKGQKKTIQ